MSKYGIDGQLASSLKPERPDTVSIHPDSVSGNRRIFYLSVQTVFNAILIGGIAKFLVLVIRLFTNISFYGKWSYGDLSPGGNHLGWYVVFVPLVGGLIVGIMARYGSPAIRGHGIPEAMEQVLLNESRINPIIILLKPLSAAISIGTGGPFGAEGPIISTGGAFGSFIGQLFRVTPDERKILLAAGACAGMSAIFGTPLSAVLLAIELLLFEFSPRSIVPVALACVTGAAMHFMLFGTDPTFPMPDIPQPSTLALVIYLAVGAVIGVTAALVSKSVYWVEDLFEHLPVHWMWWPAIGAVAVGIVGYFAPATLGVGYANITNLLGNSLPLKIVVCLFFLKFLSWCIALGSGTSGGTLAPLLTIGGALGNLLGVFLVRFYPELGLNIMTCALIGMAAMFAGASRALLTSIVFALEATMQPHGLLPLIGACTCAYFASFLITKSSIMTEKIERRGVSMPQSYEPDVLKLLQANEAMNTDPSVLMLHAALLGETSDFIFPENKLSIAIDLMAKHHLELLPVIAHDEQKTLVGVISHKEIFTAYYEHHRQRQASQKTISIRHRSLKVAVRGRRFFTW